MIRSIAIAAAPIALVLTVATAGGCHREARHTNSDDTNAAVPIDRTNLTGATVPITPPPALDQPAEPEYEAARDAGSETTDTQASATSSPAAIEPATTTAPGGAPRARRTNATDTSPTTPFPESSFGANGEQRSSSGDSFPESSFGSAPSAARDGGAASYEQNVPR